MQITDNLLQSLPPKPSRQSQASPIGWVPDSEGGSICTSQVQDFPKCFSSLGIDLILKHENTLLDIQTIGLPMHFQKFIMCDRGMSRCPGRVTLDKQFFHLPCISQSSSGDAMLLHNPKILEA